MANVSKTHKDIEVQVQKLQSRRKIDISEKNRIELTGSGIFDSDIYGDNSHSGGGYLTSIPTTDDIDYDGEIPAGGGRQTFTAPANILNEVVGEDYDPLAERRIPAIADREDPYRAKRLKMVISPKRVDPFSEGGQTPLAGARTYEQIIREQRLRAEEQEVFRQIAAKVKDGSLKEVASVTRKRRWNQTVDVGLFATTPTAATPISIPTPKTKMPTWEAETPAVFHWGETPARSKGSTPGLNDSYGKNETPRTIQETPTSSVSERRSRWDETPVANSSTAGTILQTPYLFGTKTPRMMTLGSTTPIGTLAKAMATPTPGHVGLMTPEQLQAHRWEREIDKRNYPMSDDELDGMFPEGYKVLTPPAGHIQLRTPARKLTATPTPLGSSGFYIQQRTSRSSTWTGSPKAATCPF